MLVINMHLTAIAPVKKRTEHHMTVLRHPLSLGWEQGGWATPALGPGCTHPDPVSFLPDFLPFRKGKSYDSQPQGRRAIPLGI